MNLVTASRLVIPTWTILGLASVNASAEVERPRSPVGACDAGVVEELARGLGDWIRRVQEAEHAAYESHHCERIAVVCLDRLGESTRDAVPERLTYGQTVQIDVIAPAFDRIPLTLSVSAHGRTAMWTPPANVPRSTPEPVASVETCEPAAADLQTLRDAAMPIAKFGASAGLDGLDVPVDSWTDGYWQSPDGPNIVAEWKRWMEAYGSTTPSFRALELSYAAMPGERSILIDVTRGPRPDGGGTVQRHYEIFVDHGRYPLEASVLVPFVFRGRRSVVLTETSDGAGQRISIDQDWHITAALMVQYFPLGRQRGIVSSFEGCRTRSCVENWLGVQVGLGIGDLFREWYFGFVLEPVSGLAIGLGGAVLQGQFLAAGMAEGMILPSPTSPRVDTDYMVRPYFGVTLTTDILETADRATLSMRVPH